MKALSVATLVFFLGGCGVVGELERPDPIFGEKPVLISDEAQSEDETGASSGQKD